MFHVMYVVLDMKRLKPWHGTMLYVRLRNVGGRTINGTANIGRHAPTVNKENTLKKRVYICYPCRANEHATQDENIARAIAIEAKIKSEGEYEPVATHGMFSRWNDDDDRALIMDLSKGILGKCDVV